MTRNIRFWAFVNGSAVKLTLCEDGLLRHAVSRATDEGWRTEGNMWLVENGRVIWRNATSERDCDGRFDTFNEMEMQQAKGRVSEEMPDVIWPVWYNLAYDQRDHSAEAMGY